MPRSGPTSGSGGKRLSTRTGKQGRETQQKNINLKTNLVL